jgi:hypothetical protein
MAWLFPQWKQALVKAKSMINGKAPPATPVRPRGGVRDAASDAIIDFPVVALGASAGGLDVNFREVVHSIRTRKTEVAKRQ